MQSFDAPIQIHADILRPSSNPSFKLCEWMASKRGEGEREAAKKKVDTRGDYHKRRKGERGRAEKQREGESRSVDISTSVAVARRRVRLSLSAKNQLARKVSRSSLPSAVVYMP